MACLDRSVLASSQRVERLFWEAESPILRNSASGQALLQPPTPHLDTIRDHIFSAIPCE